MKSHSLRWSCSLLILGISAAGCSKKEMRADSNAASSKEAEAVLVSKSGSSTTGTALFTNTDGKVVMTLDVANAPPGTSAVHLHQTGDCSAEDASSAGPHWNPTQQPHGQAGAGPHHEGDVGNLEVRADGTGSLTFAGEGWELGTGGPNDVVGHAVIVHAQSDDFTSQPAGNAGGRIACGVVGLKQ